MLLITEEALDSTSTPSLNGVSIALASLFSLLIGFTLGAICWKVRNIRLASLGGDRLNFIPKPAQVS